MRPQVSDQVLTVQFPTKRTRVSDPPLASTSPFGENANAKTRPSCVEKEVKTAPVSTSHNRTRPSALPLARVAPSGENATLLTRPGIFIRGRKESLCARIPNSEAGYHPGTKMPTPVPNWNSPASVSTSRAVGSIPQSECIGLHCRWQGVCYSVQTLMPGCVPYSLRASQIAPHFLHRISRYVHRHPRRSAYHLARM